MSKHECRKMNSNKSSKFKMKMEKKNNKDSDVFSNVFNTFVVKRFELRMKVNEH